VIHMLEIDK